LILDYILGLPNGIMYDIDYVKDLYMKVSKGQKFEFDGKFDWCIQEKNEFEKEEIWNSD
jgi:hypothetical protein